MVHLPLTLTKIGKSSKSFLVVARNGSNNCNLLLSEDTSKSTKPNFSGGEIKPSKLNSKPFSGNSSPVGGSSKNSLPSAATNLSVIGLKSRLPAIAIAVTISGLVRKDNV